MPPLTDSPGNARQSPAARLRAVLAQPGIIIAPGAYDCISARAIEQAGFAVCYMSGAGTAASLGFPDYGLLSLSEMADSAGRITAAVGIPVIADADTGFGNELNVVRTVREYERRGVAGLHIEDQTFPKKCGHLANKSVISRVEFSSKIRAAASARTENHFLLIARTDARAINGIQDAIDRANAALDAGADMAFVEAAQDLEEVALIPQKVHGPCLLNLVWKGRTPDISFSDAEKMGYKVAILPGMLMKAALGTFDEVLQETQKDRRHARVRLDLPPQEVFNRFGAREWDAVSERFKA
jgi:2-methylisocitrate lyase-like PEP mutase family enzyme